ncbi:MAG TPA: LamG domain-containing protein [Anaerohalosphaeraceae bacterium]|nr:LamG domain-containing protein [Anaerohalosphaeraceae bacterium]HOL87852.1 LamG domain-containing protein [Anaerohalosphaeraceae bacterium]HPP55206.1 LamG domain-containing protein [Anaerohalosphaeraceae bacterium]
MKKMWCVMIVLGFVHASVWADLLAHWTFNDPELGAAPEAALPDSDGRTVWRQAATDHSGNGNHLTTWEYAWAGFKWVSDSPAGDLSILNTGSYPAAFTWSAQSQPTGVDLETITPSAWTIEAVGKLDSQPWAATIIGRDGRDVSTVDSRKAPLYLSVRNFNYGAGNEVVAIEYTDVSGYTHEAISALGAFQLGKWYHIAAVCDGSTLKLYLGGVLVAQTDLTLSGSPNTALAIGGGTPGGDNWPGTWSVGRGMWNGYHADRWYGAIDEVAISNAALDPSQFVIAIPEPATMVLLGLGALMLGRKRS